MSVNTLSSIPTNICNRIHPNCIVCSLGNAKGLHLEFASGDDGCISATFSCDEAFEGYPGFLHGGVISSILDGAMSHCIFARGQAAVTVELATRFRHPVVIHQEASVSARIERVSHPLYILEAQIVQTGQVKATATGKFFDQPQLLIQDRRPYG